MEENSRVDVRVRLERNRNTDRVEESEEVAVGES